MRLLLIFFLSLISSLNANELCPKVVRYIVKIPNPQNCNSYIQCNKGAGTEKVCASGKEFNAERGDCDLPEHANCWDPQKEAKKKEEERIKAEEAKKAKELEEAMAKEAERKVAERKEAERKEAERIELEKQENVKLQNRTDDEVIQGQNNTSNEQNIKEDHNATSKVELPMQNDVDDDVDVEQGISGDLKDSPLNATTADPTPNTPSNSQKSNSTNTGHGTTNETSVVGVIVQGAESSWHNAVNVLSNFRDRIFKFFG